MSSDRENLVVVIAAALLAVCFYGGGIIGGRVDPDTDTDALIGVIVGLVIWLFALAPMVYTLREKREPLETSPSDEDQPEPDEEPEPVEDTVPAEPSEPVEEYPPRRSGWRT